MWCVSVLAAAAATAVLCSAHTTQLLTPPLLASPGLFTRSPNASVHGLAGPIAAPGRAPPAPADSYTYLAQWNVPEPLPLKALADVGTCLSAPDLGAGAWAAASPDARVCFDSGRQLVELAQDGARVPCGKEFDLFAAPVTATGHFTGVHAEGMQEVCGGCDAWGGGFGRGRRWL